jgi:phosphatidylglycerophosphatase C
VQTLHHEELFRRIDEACAVAARLGHEDGAIACDGDGTLWSGDIGEDFFEAAKDILLPSVHEALVEVALAEGLAARESTPRALVDEIWCAYGAGRFSEERVCEVLTWMVAGRARDELDAFATDLVERVGLRDRLQRETIAVVEHARARGIDVFLVSASPRAVVDAAARVIGLPRQNVIAVCEAVDDRGVVLTTVHRPIPYADGKVLRLREKLGARPLYAAFGDNAFDVALLREARIPVAVRPKDRLRERAADVPGLAVLARL